MIKYPEANFVKNFSKEAVEKTRDLPLYNGGPAVDYSKAKHAYALNATLLHDRRRSPEEVLARGPSDDADILLVERGSGHGKVGSFSGVSGYIDTFAHADPIAHTLRDEFATECGFTDKEFALVDFHAGTPTVEKRTLIKGAEITVVPVLGLCVERPVVRPDGREVTSYRWMGLNAIRSFERLARNFDTVTLPSALGAIGLKRDAIARLLG